jgi:hypothetical protein
MNMMTLEDRPPTKRYEIFIFVNLTTRSTSDNTHLTYPSVSTPSHKRKISSGGSNEDEKQKKKV